MIEAIRSDELSARQIAWIYLAGQALAAGAYDGTAASYADTVISRLPIGDGLPESSETSGAPVAAKNLTPQQSRIAAVEALYKEYGTKPPKGGIIAAWLKKVGDEKVFATIAALGVRGHLEKGPAYVFGALQSDVELAAPTVERVRQDGLILPSGWRWSVKRNEAVPPEEWEAA